MPGVPTCQAACELVADYHNDSVDRMLLPAILAQAGVSARSLPPTHCYSMMLRTVRSLRPGCR